MDHFYLNRNPDSLDILGQETLIRGFRDMVGNSVCCSLCCFLPLLLGDRLEKGFLDSEAGNHPQTHHWPIGREAGGQNCQVASGCSHPVSFLFFTRCTQTPAEPLIHQVSLPGPVAFYRLCAEANLFLQLLCSPRGENRTVVLVDFKLLSRWWRILAWAFASNVDVMSNKQNIFPEMMNRSRKLWVSLGSWQADGARWAFDVAKKPLLAAGSGRRGLDHWRDKQEYRCRVCRTEYLSDPCCTENTSTAKLWYRESWFSWGSAENCDF